MLPVSTRPWNGSSHCCQKNVLDRKRWKAGQELRIAIVTWIEPKDHPGRRQFRLVRLTPLEYETIMNPAVSLAG